MGQLGQLTQQFERVQYAADNAESVKIVADTKAKMDGALQTAHDTISDPTEFNTTATQGVADIHKQAVESGSNQRVQQWVSGSLSNDLIVAQNKIKHATFGKTQDRAMGDLDVAGNILADAAIHASSPEDAQGAAQSYGMLVSGMVRDGLLKQKEGQDRLLNFNKVVAVGDIQNAIKNNPVLAYKSIESGRWNHLVDPGTLDVLQRRAEATALRNENAMDKLVKQIQDDRRDRLILGIKTGQTTDVQIEKDFADRRINLQGRNEVIRELDAYTTSGGVRVSDRATYDALEYRARFGGVLDGVMPLNPREIQAASQSGKLSRSDKDHLDTITAEAMRRNGDEKDIAKDPLYVRGMKSITEILPNSDRLDLDQETKIIVGNAKREFDQAMRSGKYKPQDADQVAQSIIDTALARMGKADTGLRAKLLPGINNPQDVGAAVRGGRLTNTQAVEQLKILNQLQQMKSKQPTPSTDRNKAARELFVPGPPNG